MLIAMWPNSLMAISRTNCCKKKQQVAKGSRVLALHAQLGRLPARARLLLRCTELLEMAAAVVCFTALVCAVVLRPVATRPMSAHFVEVPNRDAWSQRTGGVSNTTCSFGIATAQLRAGRGLAAAAAAAAEAAAGVVVVADIDDITGQSGRKGSGRGPLRTGTVRESR